MYDSRRHAHYSILCLLFAKKKTTTNPSSTKKNLKKTFYILRFSVIFFFCFIFQFANFSLSLSLSLDLSPLYNFPFFCLIWWRWHYLFHNYYIHNTHIHIYKFIYNIVIFGPSYYPRALFLSKKKKKCSKSEISSIVVFKRKMPWCVSVSYFLF